MRRIKTLNQILESAGIETEYPANKKDPVYLIYNGKKILRPNPDKCYLDVLKHFGIDLKDFE